MGSKKVNSVKICEISTGRVVFLDIDNDQLKLGPNGKKQAMYPFVKALKKTDRRRVRKGLVNNGFNQLMIDTLEERHRYCARYISG